MKNDDSLVKRPMRILVPFPIGLVTILPLTVWLTLCFLVSVEAGARVVCATRCLVLRLCS